MKFIKQYLFFLLLFFTTIVIAEDIPENKMNGIKTLEKIDLMPILLKAKEIKRKDFRVRKIVLDGKKIIEVKILKRSKNIWDQLIRAHFPSEFKVGDVMSVQFLIKCTESADESAMGRCTFQHNMPWTGKWIPSILNKTHSMQTKWQRYYMPYFSKDKTSKKVCIVMEFGTYKPQTLLIAEAYWYKLPDKTEIKNLPITKISYAGREPNAQWRKEANARIEECRKGNFTLKIVNQGKAIADTEVHIKLKHHKFGFALATPSKYFKKGPDCKSEDILKYFNSIVIPNDFKWPFFKYKHCQKFIAENLEWARKNNMRNRCHCMVWGAWKHMPPGLEKLKEEPDKLKKIILDHVKEMSLGAPPIVYQWDVINEPFTEKDLTNLYGNEILDEILITAKKANKNFKTYINDYGVISGTHKLHQDAFFEILKGLKERNVPFDGIGFQAYFGSFPIAPTEVKARLDRYNVLGKEMYVTEFNMDQEDPELFADYTKDLLTLSFSYPAMTGFACWVDMWNKDGSPTQALKNWDMLVNKSWKTEINTVTDENGEIKFRGFLGTYDISFSETNKLKKYKIDFSNSKNCEIDTYSPFND